jgi:hypothetical protein
MQTRMASKQEPSVPGVIQTLADGLSIPLVAPWLLLLPIALDLYYWLGYRLSPAALTGPLGRWLDRNSEAGADSTLDSLGRSDMLSLLSQAVPALLPSIGRDDVYSPYTRPTVDLGHWAVVAIVFAFVVLLVAGLGAAFYVPLADAATGRRRSPRQALSAIGTAWLRLFALIAMIAAALILVVVPVAVIWVISDAIGLGGPVGLFILLAGVTLFVLVSFTPEAIVIAEVGPIRAVRLSYRVVRAHFWSSVGIIAATMTISYGAREIWSRITDTAPGLAIAVVMNAFVAVGLTIAGMIFFANRLRGLAGAVSR